MIKNLSSQEPRQLGGYRIEVSVQAPTLTQAKRIVSATPFLRLESWLSPETEGGLLRFRMAVKVVTKEGLLANARWVYNEAVRQAQLVGDNNTAPTRQQRQVMVDIYSAFGWNAGVRNPTRSLREDAWWANNQTYDNDPTLTLMARLESKFGNGDSYLELVERMRTRGKDTYLPCRKAMDDPRHKYFMHDKRNFRLRCGLKGCYDSLPMAQGIRWFAELIQKRWITEAAIMADTDEFGVAEGSQLVNLDISPPRARGRPPKVARHLPVWPAIRALKRHDIHPMYYSTQWTAGDGDCMFTAFAKGYDTRFTAAQMRRAAVQWIQGDTETYQPFLAAGYGPHYQTIDTYLAEMAKPGVYGDHMALQALAEVFQVEIKVLKELDNGDYRWMTVGESQTNKVHLYLSGQHYENLLALAALRNDPVVAAMIQQEVIEEVETDSEEEIEHVE